jgi:dihydrofolate reductase
MTPSLVLVAAVAENGVIGRDNALPWRLPSDLKHFKALTVGKPVIMGRRTFEAIGRPLPDRLNIVVTRQPDLGFADCNTAYSLEEAEMIAEAYARTHGVSDICIIGGGQLYAATIDRADRLEITEVHAAPDGDARFPPIDSAEWREVRRSGPEQREKDDVAMSFVTYERARQDEATSR